MTEFDLAGEAASQLAPELTSPSSQNSGPTRRTDQRDEARQDAAHRYQSGNGRPRTPVTWTTGPTQPLAPVTASTGAGTGAGTVQSFATHPGIPAAREETVELPVTEPPPDPGGPGAEPSPAPTQVPAQVSRRSRRETTGDESIRPAADDAAADSWNLVERAQDGDKEAFALLYLRYKDAVYRFIYFRVLNRQLAEDLLADTFLRALRRIGSVTWQGRDLGAWLTTIARHLVADHFKSGRSRFEVVTGDVLDADKEERGPEGSPETAVVDHITNVTLLRAVQQLNPEQRQCIVLRFLHGFSVAETAQAMGKNEGAIKALQYRAVRALHRLLPEGFQP